MGNQLRAGRDRDTGAQRLSRLFVEPAAGSPPDADDDADDDDSAVDRWGATGMPDWLDTRRGRQAWTGRGEDFDCLDDDGGGRDDPPADDDDDEWEAPRRRWLMLPPAAIGLILVGLVACGFAGYSLLRQNEPTTPLVAFDAGIESAPPPTASVESPASSTHDRPIEVVVSVVGLVHEPGLVRMPPDSRVADALARAGGARPGADTMSLNLAQIVRDGDQILVGRSGDGQVRSAVVSSSGGQAGPGASTAATAPTDGTGLVNLNTATEAELDALPGIGPVTAQSILAWRQTNGSFSSVDQLAEVDGIGDGRLAKLRPLVTVGR
ncbi:helix-hairpin-helix domain-containing protein [Gordonia humi]|uniref:Competence protein ComEA n=1 Tax=Gordonia humi TaxID=686429 RepID=A0A840F3R1_9ACTN|nr:helix-hairpin-helix domain-containing protein [Gordonia humi]MBB4137098.1 competence protein ComEA [Gordonia humi]